MQTINYPFLRKSIDYYKSLKLRKYYSSKKPHATNQTKWIIYMADGKMLHGGLSDRLCGILSMYAYAKKHGYEFKILFINPYKLADILLPNQYNWLINQSEISYNAEDAYPIYLSVYSKDHSKVVKYIDSRLDNRNVKQIHVYSNSRYFTIDQFPLLFEELFVPCQLLRKSIDDHLKMLGNDYVSFTFRFQQLLGDFKEGNFTVLSNEFEKERLINKCLCAVEYLHQKENVKRILVTSDSKTFLEKVAHLSYVYVIPGEIRHMDFTNGEAADIAVDIKSYVDMFLIANARAVYLCNIPPLYHSGFPKTSSYIYGKPYHEITEEMLNSYMIL